MYGSKYNQKDFGIHIGMNQTFGREANGSVYRKQSIEMVS